MSEDDRAARLHALWRAASELAQPDSALGRRARAALTASTGLSPEGVEYGLSECLEVNAGRAALTQLLRRAPPAPRVHVLLAANVFIGAYRAIALALAQSTRVAVRSSRRDPTMATLLWEASGEVFELTEELAPAPGESLWAYGSDETLAELRRALPAGVRFHAHGSGMGVAVVRQPEHLPDAVLREAADSLAEATMAFDQRGCLSPRVVLVEGDRPFAESFAAATAEALTSWESIVPRGKLSSDELADAERFVATFTYVGGLRPAGRGAVCLDPVDDRVFVPPVGRYLGFVRTSDALPLLERLGARVTTVGFFHGERLPGLCRERLGERRYVELGRMQRPILDGPVDLRRGWGHEVL
jgi:hypothetical protein